MNSEITKKLLKLIGLILIISFGLDKLVFFSLNKISDEVMTGQAIGKLNQFLSIKDSTDFIVFGNSRANHHIDVDLFSKNGFNIGVDGVGIAYNSTLINTLKNDKKQLILIHIDTKNFFDPNYDGSDIRGLKTKYHREKNITNSLNKSKSLSVLQRFYYSMNYNGNSIGILKNYFKPSYNYKTYSGYDPLTVSNSQQEMRDIILAKANTSITEDCMGKTKMNTTAVNYLKSIKSFIDNSPNKKFIFVTTPIYNDTCNEDNKLLSTLMQDLGLKYLDFTNLYKDTKDNSYWKDATHMSVIGAEKFSAYLSEKLKPFM
ncbi:hypothetical protein HNV10_09640 [Winogradskyella litoriviva]|uniref:SGNH/GDSL hydrolase family protein n=1 Tax=Winogradskyella litoriviva TaxID=1220182 RepID=A0ABX2E728_9FLAO|nr:hypothetical protein [Winogradskyella litoriviva]NRD23501.1 hypothetical protein [Winogradskyella litoriviva]